MEGGKHRRSLSDSWAVLYNNLSLEDGPRGAGQGELQALVPEQQPFRPLAAPTMPSLLGMGAEHAADDALKPALMHARFGDQQQQQHSDATGGRPARARKPSDKAALGVVAVTGKRTHAGAKGKDSNAAGVAAAVAAATLERTIGESGSAGHQRRNSFTPALPAVQEREGGDDGPAHSPRGDAAYDDDGDDDDDDSDDYSGGGRGKKGGGGGRRGSGSNGRNRGELLTLDPKRVKRILANRLSAARSKERRIKYAMELEGKVSVLEDEVERLAQELEAQQARAAAAARARADADGRAMGLQQVLAHASAANQALAAELLELQRALGLPERLPPLPPPQPAAESLPLQQGGGQQQQQQAGTAQQRAPKVERASQQQQQQPQAHDQLREQLVPQRRLQQPGDPSQHRAPPQQAGAHQQQRMLDPAAAVIKQEAPPVLGDDDGDVEMLAELLGVTGSPLCDEDSLAGAAGPAAPTGMHAQQQQQQEQAQLAHQQQQPRHQQRQSWHAGDGAGPCGAIPGGPSGASLGPPQHLRAAPTPAPLQQPVGLLMPTMSDPLTDCRSALTDDGASTTPSWSGLCSTPSGPRARISDGASLPQCLQPQPPPQLALLQQQQQQPLHPVQLKGAQQHQQLLLSQPLAMGLSLGGQLHMHPPGPQHQRSASAGSLPHTGVDFPGLVFPLSAGPGMALPGSQQFAQHLLQAGAAQFGAAQPAPALVLGMAPGGGAGPGCYLVTTPGPAGGAGQQQAAPPDPIGGLPMAPFSGLG